MAAIGDVVLYTTVAPPPPGSPAIHPAVITRIDTAPDVVSLFVMGPGGSYVQANVAHTTAAPGSAGAAGKWTEKP